MAIKQKLTLVAAPGSNLINLDDWAKASLPEEEFPLFEAAKARHNAFVASKATSVDHENGEVIFADENKVTEANPLDGDMDFLFYWYRYLQENGITVNQTTETV
jgi:5-methylcytosine-specific restriction endonuclease McrBC regulatory subunit McrC